MVCKNIVFKSVVNARVISFYFLNPIMLDTIIIIIIITTEILGSEGFWRIEALKVLAPFGFEGHHAMKHVYLICLK